MALDKNSSEYRQVEALVKKAIDDRAQPLQRKIAELEQRIIILEQRATALR